MKTFLKLLTSDKIDNITSKELADNAIAKFVKNKDQRFLEVTKKEWIEQKENILNTFMYNSIIEHFEKSEFEDIKKTFNSDDDAKKGQQDKKVDPKEIKTSQKEINDLKYKNNLSYLKKEAIGKVRTNREAEVINKLSYEQILNFDIATGDINKLLNIVLDEYPEWKKKFSSTDEKNKKHKKGEDVKTNLNDLDDNTKKLAKDLENYVSSEKNKNKIIIGGKEYEDSSV